MCDWQEERLARRHEGSVPLVWCDSSNRVTKTTISLLRSGERTNYDFIYIMFTIVDIYITATMNSNRSYLTVVVSVDAGPTPLLFHLQACLHPLDLWVGAIPEIKVNRQGIEIVRDQTLTDRYTCTASSSTINSECS